MEFFLDEAVDDIPDVIDDDFLMGVSRSDDHLLTLAFLVLAAAGDETVLPGIFFSDAELKRLRLNSTGSFLCAEPSSSAASSGSSRPSSTASSSSSFPVEREPVLLMDFLRSRVMASEQPAWSF